MRPALLLLASLLLAAPAPAAEALPEGCQRESARIVLCAWRPAVGITTTMDWDTSLSGLHRSVVELRITPSVPTPYTFSILDRTENASQMTVFDTGTYSGVHLVDLQADHDTVAALQSGRDPNGLLQVIPVTFDITLRLEEATGVLAPSTPAGGPGDLQLADARGDADRPGLDLVGAWFDDPLLDDGLFEVGILLDGLDELEVEPHARARVDVRWTLLGDRYSAIFVYEPPNAPYAAAIGQGEGWRGQLWKNSAATLFFQVSPDLPNGTLRAALPIRSVGDPAAGVLFANLSAVSYYGPPSGVGIPGQLGGAGFGGVQEEDSATQQIRPFALGGPEIWTQLRGLTPLTVAPTAAPWYRDPFSTDNLPDTLQVGGAALAGLTALWGLFVVRRRREALARLLDDVDAVLEVHAGDREGALAALRRLRERHDALWRKGAISEGQHAMLQARVEGATGRLILEQKAG